jgi:hypothetical protein
MGRNYSSPGANCNEVRTVLNLELRHESRVRLTTSRTLEDNFPTLLLTNPQLAEARLGLRNSVSTNTKLVILSKMLKHDLSKTVWAWRQFRKGDIRYFQDQSDDSSKMQRSLIVIEQKYSSLELLLLRLEDLSNRLSSNNVSTNPCLARGIRG